MSLIIRQGYGRRGASANRKSSIVNRKSKGLGDTVAKVAEATGVAAVVRCVEKLTKKRCGCKKRQKKLNELVPYE